ncbi:MAG: hypothetical protein ABI383_15045 [Acidobacteriaceae bacterium]
MRYLMLLPALGIAAMLSAQTSSQTTTNSAARHRRAVKHEAARPSGAGPTGAGPTIREQLDQIRQAMQAQQQQIDSLRQQLAQRDQQLQAVQTQAQQGMQAVTAAQQAQSSADQANQKADQVAQSVQTTNQEVESVKAKATTTDTTIQQEQKRVGSLESPAAVHFKGITITPGGYIAAESVYRQHGLGADINTPFNGINLPGSGAYHQSEFFGSGRQSRLSLLAEGKYNSVKIGGYYEADFLSAGVTSNNNESNSYTLRQRQLFAQAALDSGWTFTGGQMWSLVTETKSGLENRSEALPMTIDAQYHVGFSWARQYGFRVTRNFGKKVFLGASVENPQTLVTTHGNLPNFNLGQPGSGGGLYNATANYSYNLAPDFIAKAAFEPGWGHYEVFGIVSQFRDRIYPGVITATGTSVAGAYNDSRTGGGIGGNARGSIFHKHVDLGLHFLGGSGVGRYGTSTLPDATIRPNGSYALLKNYQALGTLEYHSTRWDWYANAGGEYAGRSYFTRPGATPGSVTPVGYGSPQFSNTGCLTEVVPTGANGFVPGGPASCNNDTRDVLEGTLGFWYKFYTGPKGRLQMGGQYSYLTRSLWTGVGGGPHTVENMALTSFRYYLP